MKKFLRSFFLLPLFFLVLSVFSTQAFAASFYIGNVKTSDNDGQLGQSLKALMSASVSNAGGSVSEDEAAADFTLRGDVIRLGGAYVLTVSRWRGSNQLYSARQKANTIQDLDDAADRAVRAAMIGNPTKKDTRVGEVSEKEKHEMRDRIKSKNSVYLGFGPAGFQNMGASLLSYNLSLGYVWGVAPQWDVKVMADAVVAGDWKTSILDGTLGLDYYFTDENMTPYITAGLGFGASATSASAATTIGGFAGDIGLGFQLFRISSTQFDLSLVYNGIFGNNTIGAPGFYAFRVGVLF